MFSDKSSFDCLYKAQPDMRTPKYDEVYLWPFYSVYGIIGYMNSFGEVIL